MRVLVTGATGFLGSHLLGRLEGPVVLTRDPAKARERLPGIEAHRWIPEEGPPPPEAFEGVQAVFHLAAESVGSGRWTGARKRRIRDSRVVGTRNLVEGLTRVPQPPPVLVSASGVGFYGFRDDQELVEDSSPGNDFLAEVCKSWEAEALRARSVGIRVVLARMGMVLGDGGGALASMLPAFRVGLGGPMGTGDQWMPWIHVDDVVGLWLHAVVRQEITGPLNIVAPVPVRNREFARTLGRSLGVPSVIRAPALALKLALGEFSEVLLGSQRVVPRLAQETGYVFRHPTLEGALGELRRR
jgi:hypothetical protein